ncbi:unnamed protein product [Protopolystoma xenopodis]|uniref:Uncharacterized protein n=1 Tax=Protopolystoma xenopodis TaxID=117903 RepID=A0A3S5B397_9PLAT|nr:unnamed protein product [Protopolystoma xenopodis]
MGKFTGDAGETSVDVESPREQTTSNKMPPTKSPRQHDQRLPRKQRQHESSRKANRHLVKQNLPSSSGGIKLRISSANTFTRNGSRLNKDGLETRSDAELQVVPTIGSHAEVANRKRNRRPLSCCRRLPSETASSWPDGGAGWALAVRMRLVPRGMRKSRKGAGNWHQPSELLAVMRKKPILIVRTISCQLPVASRLDRLSSCRQLTCSTTSSPRLLPDTGIALLLATTQARQALAIATRVVKTGHTHGGSRESRRGDRKSCGLGEMDEPAEMSPNLLLGR